MTKTMNSRFYILNSIKRAYQYLRILFDPAIEGNPYATEVRKIKFLEIKRDFVFRRKLALR